MNALRAGGVKTLYIDRLAKNPHYLSPSSKIYHAGGLYSPKAGVIFLPRILGNGKPNDFPGNNLRHELGHPFDHLTGGSLSAAFLQVFRANLKKIGVSTLMGNGCGTQTV